MGIVVPKVRKHLCADALLRSVHDVFCHIPEHRKGDPDIPLRDALMSAFAMFSLKSPSLLAFDKERTEDNLQRVYGIGRVPCDTSMRETLDPVKPEHLRPAFKGGFRQLQRGKALEEMVFVDAHYLLALDGMYRSTVFRTPAGLKLGGLSPGTSLLLSHLGRSFVSMPANQPRLVVLTLELVQRQAKFVHRIKGLEP